MRACVCGPPAAELIPSIRRQRRRVVTVDDGLTTHDDRRSSRRRLIVKLTDQMPRKVIGVIGGGLKMQE